MKRFSSQQWESFFKAILQVRIRELEFIDTKLLSILPIISHIDFQRLTKLSLLNNNITSIESLAHLNAPYLSYVDLGSNCICQSKSLSKINFKKMNYLEICDNPLFQLNIGRVKWQQSKIYTRLVTNSCGYFFQQVSFLAKLQKNSVSCIMQYELKYYNGESGHQSRYIKKTSEQKIITQKKIVDSLKNKLKFQKN